MNWIDRHKHNAFILLVCAFVVACVFEVACPAAVNVYRCVTLADCE